MEFCDTAVYPNTDILSYYTLKVLSHLAAFRNILQGKSSHINGNQLNEKINQMFSYANFVSNSVLTNRKHLIWLVSLLAGRIAWDL